MSVLGPTRRLLVVLVRHGESRWNAENRYQGQQGTGLSARGVEQARWVDSYLRSAFAPVHRVVASDLQRVVETTGPFADSTGLRPAYDERWREIDLGSWGGRLMSEIAVEYPDEVAAAARGEDVRRGGGETLEELRKRVASAMSDLVADEFDDVPPGEEARAVVFTHGGPIRAAAAHAMKLPAGGVSWLDGPDNCSVTVLRHSVDTNGAVRRTALVRYGSATWLPDALAAGSETPVERPS